MSNTKPATDQNQEGPIPVSQIMYDFFESHGQDMTRFCVMKPTKTQPAIQPLPKGS